MQKCSLIRRAYSFNVLKEEASNFLLWDFKNEIFQLDHA